MRKLLFILVAAFIVQGGQFHSANAQVNQVRLRVDGLACSFCAYGLEKKLKKLDGVKKVTVALNKGMVALEGKEGHSISFSKIETLVKDAGFTLRECRVTAEGAIQKSGDGFALTVTGTDEKIILENNDKLAKLLILLGDSQKPVKVRGSLLQKSKSPQEKHSTLSIEWFKVK